MDAQTYLHRNGGGRILGAEGGIGSDCFLSIDSRLEGRSFVSYNSSVRVSAIKDSSIISSVITDSVVVDSHIAGAIVIGSALENVIVRSTTDRQASLLRVSLSDDVVVEGCRVQGFTLSGPYLIHTDWDRAPRIRLLETNSGLRMGVSECGREDRFHLGCCCRPWSEWDRKEGVLRRLFVDNRGWPLDLFDSIRGIFAEWRQVG